MGKRKRDDNSEGKNGESAGSEALEKDVASAPKRFKPDDGPEGSWGSLMTSYYLIYPLPLILLCYVASLTLILTLGAFHP